MRVDVQSRRRGRRSSNVAPKSRPQHLPTLVHQGAAQEGALGAMLAGSKAPMSLALIARRSAWVVAGIDYVNIESGQFGGIQFEQRFSEQKML